MVGVLTIEPVAVDIIEPIDILEVTDVVMIDTVIVNTVM